MGAYVLRISPSGNDRLPEALENDEIIIGWANAPGLLDADLNWRQFRRIIRDQYHPNDETLHGAGASAGHMWRFIRAMQEGDLVLVPYGQDFYVAKVAGEAYYRDDKRVEDTAYRRPVHWLNEKKPIPRSYARAALISRMKIYGTSASANDLVSEVQECLRIAETGKAPTFLRDIQRRVVAEAAEELQSGRLNDYDFERLIKALLKKLGAPDARVLGRAHEDQGADVVGTFQVSGVFPATVAVQAKHWRPHPPVGEEEVEQLISGMEAEGADFGMVVTSGTVSEAAIERAKKHQQERAGQKVELVDGEQLAKLLVESGISSWLESE